MLLCGLNPRTDKCFSNENRWLGTGLPGAACTGFPDTWPSLVQARRHPPRSLARRVSPDCDAGRLASVLANAAIKSAPSSRCRTAESGRLRGGMTTAARSRARGSRAWFPSRVRERGPLDELAGVPLTPLRFVLCTPAISSPRSPTTPDAGPLKFMGTGASACLPPAQLG